MTLEKIFTKFNINKMEEKVTVEKQKLQQLITNFFDVCSLCDEINISEFEEGDQEMQKMKEWVTVNFGRKI